MADHRTGQQLDVRLLRKPDKHPTILAACQALTVGGSFVLVNDRDPRYLRDEGRSDRKHGRDPGRDGADLRS